MKYIKLTTSIAVVPNFFVNKRKEECFSRIMFDTITSTTVQKRGLFGTPKTVRALSPGNIYRDWAGVFGTPLTILWIVALPSLYFF